MAKRIFFIFLTLLIVSGALFSLPLKVRAIRPTISATISPDPARVGEAVTISITVSSNYELTGDRVEVWFGDGSPGAAIACDMSVHYAVPPQTCSGSITHTYSAAGDYTLQLLACSNEALPDCHSIHPVAHILDILVGPTGYDNPLMWNTILHFLLYLLRFVFNIGLGLSILMIVLGGIFLATSRGDPVRQNKGKRTLFFALIGLGVAVLANGLFLLFRIIFGVRDF